MCWNFATIAKGPDLAQKVQNRKNSNRFTRRVVELVPLDHSSLRSSCPKPFDNDCLVQLVTIYYRAFK
jgi:hypothetical protein